MTSRGEVRSQSSGSVINNKQSMTNTVDIVSKLNSPDMVGGIEYKPVALDLKAEGCVFTVGGKVLTS